MNRQIKVKAQLLLVLCLVVVALTLWFMAIGLNLQPLTVAAQEPDKNTPPPSPISEETLRAFGLSPGLLQTAVSPFNLAIVKKAKPTTVDSGNLVTFTILITNQGSNTISYTLFYDDYPTQMQNVQYLFSTSAVSDGLAKPTWLLYDPIPGGSTAVVTVTGKLSSFSNATVTNKATVTAFNAQGATIKAATVNVNITGTAPPGAGNWYLPLLIKSPPPPPKILAYFEDFNNGDPWIQFDVNDCQTEDTSGQYWVRLKDKTTCLPPADDNDRKPERPYRKYGEFEVTAYQSEGASRDTAFGLFINGEGGDNYYYFRIWPNNSCGHGGDWQLIRRSDGDENTLRSGSCNTAIIRGKGSSAKNTLTIVHTSNRQLSVYANGVQLGSTYTESSSNELDGIATGVYAFTDDDDADNSNPLIKFDNFKVYRFPN